MDYGTLTAEVARFTYRPGWVLSIIHDRYLGPCLFILARVENAYSDLGIDLGIKSPVPWPVLDSPDPDLLKRWVMQRVIEAEVHEAREWLRYDGNLIDNPHPDL